jgi:hypothetical protein
MIFIEGTEVAYKNISGVVVFVTEKSISILVSKGKHRSKDVKVVVHQSEFKNVVLLNEK